MNHKLIQSGQEVQLTFNGQITIKCETLNTLLAEMRQAIQAEPPAMAAPTPKPQVASSPQATFSAKDQRLAYTMRETAELLGVSYISVHRLIKRGLLKSLPAFRHKIIPKYEIERFLKETI